MSSSSFDGRFGPLFNPIGIFSVDGFQRGDDRDNDLDGGATSDTIEGLGGNDSIRSFGAADEVFGGNGFDTIEAGAGNDTVYGGNGRDQVFLNQNDDLFVDNSQGGELGRDTVFGGFGNDTIQGGNGNDSFYGEAGNDVIFGRLGADQIFGGDGFDTISANEGADTVYGGNGRDLVYLNQGNDLFVDNGQGGELGRDTVFAGLGNDTIQGGNGNDEFHGQWGNDLIFGRLGNDLIFGGDGFDTINANQGNDTVHGGNGRDLVFLNQNDDLFVDNSQGGELGRDTVWAGLGDDTIQGGNGDDIFRGEAGDDVIFGRLGADQIFGGAGADTIEGGAGNDSVFGGAGSDSHRFTGAFGNDLIRDFRLSDGDILDFSDTNIEFDGVTVAGDGAGGTLVTTALGTVRLEGVASGTIGQSAFFFASQKTQTSDSGNGDKVSTTATGNDLSIQSNQGGALIGMNAFRADPVFQNYDGTGYTVVVLDTGIDLDHPAFGPDANGDGISDRILYSQDFSPDRDGTADDVQGHGSNVSSIIGSSDSRFLGVAPDVNIIALQALGNNGSGTNTGIENALQWVVDNAATYNVVAVNMSLGPSDNVNAEARNRFMGDELQALHDAGIITTVAVGNDYFRYQQPGVSSIAADPSVIPVGAVWSGDFGRTFNWGSGAKDFTTDADRVTSFSQRSDDIDMVFAPGALISGARPGGGFSSQGGTSQATPMVAGMAALAQEIADDLLGRRLSPDEFHQLLIDTSISITDGDDEDDNVTNLNTQLERVDMLALARAIQALGGGTPPPPPPSDDFAGDTSTTGTLGLGATATGTIERGGDQDWFRIDLTAGDSYRLELRGAPTGDGTLSDPRLALLDDAGAVIVTNDDGGQGRNSLIDYTAQSSGTFYLAAQSFGAQTGTYTVALARTAQAVADDFAGDATTSSTVTVGGGRVFGVVEQPGDRDWHRVTLEAGGQYVIDVTRAGGPNQIANPYLRLYDSTGTLLAENDDGGSGLNAQLLFNATATGTYYIGAAGSGDTGTGGYNVAVSGGRQGGGNDVPADASTTVTLAPGDSYDGALEVLGDRDWIRTTLTGGTVYDLALAGSGASPLRDPYLRVFDANGDLVAQNDDFNGLNSRIETLSVNSTGTYFLSAGAYGDRGEGTYRMTLAERGGGAQDIPADRSTTSSIAPGGSTSSVIGAPGDRDWHEISLEANQTYRISLDGSGATALRDPILRLYDASSSLVATDDDGGPGLNSELVFTATTTGSYYLSAGAFADNGQGGYTVSAALVNSGTRDDFAGDRTTSGRVDGNGQVTGTVEAQGDRDWFAISVQRGAVYEFSLEGSPTSSGTISDPTLHVRDAFGTSLAFNDDGGAGLNSLMQFSAQTTGTVYLDAGGFGASTGSYTLSSRVVSSGGDDHGDDLTTGSTVDVGGTANGALEASGDNDVFAVELERGATYDFAVGANGSGNGSLTDSTLTLLNETGTVIAFDDDDGPGRDSLIEQFVAGYSGTHFLSVAGFGGRPTGSYVLGVAQTGAPTSDDFGDTPATAGSIAVGGVVNGALEDAGDRDLLRITLPGNEFFRFDLRAASSTLGTLADPFLRVYDSFGNLVGLDDDGGTGRDSSLIFNTFFQPTRDYFLEVRAFGDNGVGTWQLAADDFL